MDENQCAAHTTAIVNLKGEVSNARGDVKLYRQEVQQSIRESKETTRLLIDRVSQHSADIRAIRSSQENEIKWWTRGKKVALWIGLPSILGWIIYIAGFFKGVKP